jgi:ribosomal protein L32
MSDTCKHGSLARSCEICERDKEIESLRAEVEWLRERYQHACSICFLSPCHKCGMPMRPGGICEACGRDRTDDGEERGDE